jgi:hypothetical protein
LFAESEVKTKLERFVRKRKELMVMGLALVVNYYFNDRSRKQKRIHLWLMMNKQPLLEQYLTGI